MTIQTVAGPAPSDAAGRRRLAFYSMHIVNLYRAKPVGSIGGAEVQYSLLARELAQDHDVHLVTLSPAQPDEVTAPAGQTST